jgi:hypothetical protein
MSSGLSLSVHKNRIFREKKVSLHLLLLRD